MTTAMNIRHRLAQGSARRRRGMQSSSAEAGFTIIEVLVSGMIVLLGAMAVLGSLEASGRAGAEQRHRAESYVIGQQDQARLRGLKISQLANLSETRVVKLGGVDFTVASQGQFVTDSTGTVSCDSGTASADYINISSTVSWSSGSSTPPTVVKSLIAPPNGSIAADRGALAVAVRDGPGNGIPGIALSGSGPGAFSGQTGSNGCALFANLPQGNYTLNAGASAGVVDSDGKPPAPQTVSVVGQSTNTVVLQYDEPGSVAVSFRTRFGSTILPSKADSIVAFNTGMVSGAAAFGTIGTPVSSLTAAPLFPFASPDTIYAGSCTDNNPNPTDVTNPPNAAAIANVDILPGTSSPPQTIQLPALDLTVRSGNSSSSPGSVVPNATVKVTDLNCTDANDVPIKRTYLTNTAGQLPDPGLPFGSYGICASNTVPRKNTVTNVPVQSTATNTARTIYLGSSATGISSGACP